MSHNHSQRRNDDPDERGSRDDQPMKIDPAKKYMGDQKTCLITTLRDKIQPCSPQTGGKGCEQSSSPAQNIS